MANNKNRTQSIKGETVDFDLMRIKNSMENRDKPDSAELREKYIDIRRRRNPRRNVADLVNEQRLNQEDARAKIELGRKRAAAAAAAAVTEPYDPQSETVDFDFPNKSGTKGMESSVETLPEANDVEPVTVPDVVDKAEDKASLDAPKTKKIAKRSKAED